VSAERFASGRFAAAVGVAVVAAIVAPGPAGTARAQDSASIARAEERTAQSSAVYVEAGPCSVVPREQVLPLLRVELGPRLLAAPAQDAVRVRIECSVDAVLVSAWLADAPPRSQRLNLTAVPASLRARIVALQVAEIVREHPAVAAGVIQPARPAPAPLRPSSRAAAIDAPAQDVLRNGLQLQLFAQASAYHRDGRWLAGAGVRVEHGLSALRFGLDAVLATRGDGSELGRDRVLSAYVAPHVAWRFSAGRTAARLGVGQAIGHAWIRGDSRDADGIAGRVNGPWAAPFVLAGASHALGSAFAVHVRAEAGWVVLPVIGEVARARDVELSGLWTNFQLGAALAF
jgi:hypothetical protein